MGDALDPGAAAAAEWPSFGLSELVSAAAGSQRVLDAGCGSGRLTVMLARMGAKVTGIDTSNERLGQARRRAVGAGVGLRLVEADLNVSLPFADASFDAVTSRLVLMAAEDPVATLRELRRVLGPEGRLATVIWASLKENPWFAEPREAIAAALGDSRASFARAFGRLGDPDEAAAVHRAAGLRAVEACVLRERVAAADAAQHWQRLARENGHFRRVAADLSDEEDAAVVDEIATRLAGYQEKGRLLLPRALVLVSAHR